MKNNRINMKNQPRRNASVFFSSLLIFMLHLPFVFANTKPVAINKAIKVKDPVAATLSKIEHNNVYAELHLNDLGLSEEAFMYALKGYEYLKERGRIENEDIITIIDFTKPSTQKRLFVIDLKNCNVLFNTYVAHGQGSGEVFANKFSNIPESYQSSLGFYVTADTYNGKNGYSMRLVGLETGINDKADERAIVMHGAPYVSESYIRSQGHIGRSWGCPAVPEKLCKPIIGKIKNGSCLFVFGKNKKYAQRSRILNS